MVMLCMLYGEKYALKFTLSLMPLIYYCVDEESSLNWVDFLLASLEESNIAKKETTPR
jgi:hypothetical protein